MGKRNPQSEQGSSGKKRKNHILSFTLIQQQKYSLNEFFDNDFNNNCDNYVNHYSNKIHWMSPSIN